MPRLTEPAGAALGAARRVAARIGNTEVDGEHLLLALLDHPDGAAARLLAGLGGDPEPLRVQLEEELTVRPRVAAGDGACPDPERLPVSRRLRLLLAAAERESDGEPVGEEDLLVALADEGPRTPGGQRLLEHGVDAQRCRAALEVGRAVHHTPVDRSTTTDAW